MTFLRFIIMSLVVGTACDRQNLSKAALSLLDTELSKVACDKNAPTKELLSHQRLTQTNSAASVACHLTFLKNHPDDSWIWSSLGQLYLLDKQNSQAGTCFKQAAKSLGRVSTHVTDWFILGPFPIGKAEVDGDPTEFFGGVDNVSRSRYKKSQKFLSELAMNGEISWKLIHQSTPDENVRFNPDVKSINWNELVQSLGSMGITEFQAWAVGEFVVTQDDVTVGIQCLGVHTIYVDDVLLTGEIYWREQHSAFLVLNAGIHTISIRLRSKGNANFRCNLREQTAAFNILSPSFLPDLVDGHLFSYHIGLPIVNSHGINWLRDIRVKIDNAKTDSDFSIVVKPLQNNLEVAPGQTLSLPIQLSATTDRDKVLNSCTGSNVLKIPMKVLTSEGSRTFEVNLRCRTKGQSFLFTFLDHDGSVQHGAAIAPRGQCDLNLCPVVLTLHGTTVPPQNQADSYKHMENGEFVFGFENAWVLAPTRHGAHNWEGPGALTAFAALHSLQELTLQHDWVPMKASERHVIYAGHSMGGHGAWHLATHYPDLGLALVSLAGWISKEQYGDSNLFFKHDVAVSHTDPAVKAVLEACIGENDVDKHASNLKGMAVLMRVGQQDRTVHPYYGRRMYRVLHEWDVNVTYVELPGKEHWWWDTVSTNDGGCMNDKPLRQFVTQHTASLHHQTHCQGDDQQRCHHDNTVTTASSSSADEDVTFTLTVTNPAFAGPMRGCAIHQQLVPHRISRINVQVSQKNHVAVLRTINVRRLALAVSTHRPVSWFTMDLKIDSTVFSRDELVGLSELHLCRHMVQGLAEWHKCTPEELIASELQRSPLQLGPARRVAEAPFYIVIGTQGGSESSVLIQQLAVYISNQFILTSDSLAPLIRDEDLTTELANTYNLIVIGNPVENAITNQLLSKTPLSWDSGQRSLRLGSCVYDDPDTGVLFLAPHSNSRLALVLMGNSLQGLRDVATLATPTIPPMTRSPFSNLIPDFIITGPQYRAMGSGGYECAGFWSNSWQAASELVSCAHCIA